MNFNYYIVLKYIIVFIYGFIFSLFFPYNLINKYYNTPKLDENNKSTIEKATPINLPTSETWIKYFKKTYNNKSKISIEETIIVWSWNGGNTIKLDQLKQTVIAVQERISIPNNEHTVALILETSAVESSRGIDMIQKGGGPARGLLQMEPATEKWLKKWLKKNHPSIYQEVIHFYNNKKDATWNRTYNVPYQIAMSTAYYWHKCGDKLFSLITTRENRAKVWKQYYNTMKGKGTISKYHKKSEKYL